MLTEHDLKLRNDLIHALAKQVAEALTGSSDCDCQDITEGDGYFFKVCAVHQLLQAFFQAHQYFNEI